ncbi:33 kDa chaperonin [Rubrivivax sp. A210]|uniref:Hsp33 family molecular chaperone HslO n=1 Tax=Rubrivivax sp. A210 TaxID=2772301 RepID=UPI0019189A65|nr:Hsp33 family molecular chaperone HslO [Rubrivivax sp. A210]CAD5374574.1 33 kDa chaperonin [Rubrivivax sp. A210]
MSELVKFLFEGLPVRGMLVYLDEAWQELLRRRQTVGAHAPEVRTLLGELAAAGVLMQSNIKFNGALLLQIHGDGPVKLAVAEVQPDLAFRATATVVGAVPPGAQLAALCNPGGKGRCAITLDPRDKLPGQQPYQGVVPLHGDQREPLQQVAQVLEHYMLQSEQLDTRLVLASDERVAAGLLIQRLPVEGEGNLGGGQGGRRNEDEIGQSEAFTRIALLAATLTREELLTLGSEQILRRLFWEEPLRVFEPMRPRFACSCSRERVTGMLQSLGREESDGLIAERGRVEVGCEFCGLQYRFDAVDVAGIFTPPGRQAPGSQAVN